MNENPEFKSAVTDPPKIGEWYICFVSGQRQILMYNNHNNFWADFAGKTYRPEQIDKWLDDKG